MLVEAPDRAGGGADGLNVCVTDNEAMARWLVSDFATQFSAFRGTKALDSLEYRAFHGASRGGDGIASYTETVTGDGIEARLAWDDLSAPFMVEMPPAQSATGKHEMFSLFVDAGRGSATVNGRPVLGHAVPRDFAGRRSSTAFLAFSETWVVPS